MRNVMYRRACAAVVLGALALAVAVALPISGATPVLAQGTVAVTPGATALVVTKVVRDVTTNSAFSTNMAASSGDLLQYSVTVSNPTAATASGVVVSDTLTAGQSYATSPPCSPSCYFSGATIFFNLGTLASGTASAPVTFAVYVSSAASGAIVSNVATTTSSLGTSSSQPTYIVVNGTATVPSGSCVSSPCGTPCGFSPCANTCGFVACGTPCGFNPCANTCGFNPCGTTCGTCPALPSPCSFCAPTTCAFSCATTTCATSNCFALGTGQNMLCGTVSAFTAPTAATAGSLTMNGMQVTLMPFMVPSGQIAVGQQSCISLVMNTNLQATSAVVSSNLPGINCGCSFSIAGVPSCSLLSTSGVVQGSLSLVPTAARAVQDPTWVHHVTRTTYAT